MTTLIRNLELLGLSEKEIKIFIALLEESNLTAYQIYKVLGFQRTSVYPLLEKLLQKGLILEKTEGNKKIYSTIDPESLKELVDSKVTSLNQFKKEIPDIIRQIKNQPNHKLIQKYVVYYGEKGILTIFEEIARFKGEVYAMGSLEGVSDFAGEKYYEQFYNKTRRKNLGVDYMISDWTKMTVNLFFKESGMFTKRRWLPAEIEIEGCYIIFGNKLVVSKYEPEIITFVIEDKGLVELFKLAYFSLWKELEGKNIPSQPTP